MENINENDSQQLLDLTSDIVSSYVSKNPVQVADLPALIESVHRALDNAGNANAIAEAEKPKPAVNPKKSITDDYIICLEDGKHFKSLKRHIKTHYNLTPEAYREKWGLDPNYPMVAPNYAKARSALAKEMGLGRKANA